MKHLQNISHWLSAVLVFIFFAGPAAAKLGNGKTNESSTMAPGKQETPPASASSQDESAQNAGSEQPMTSERRAAERLEKAPEIDYAIGMAAYRVKNWPRTIIAFEKVRQASQKFRDVDKRLAHAHKNLARESKESIVARYYAEGVIAINRDDFGWALAAFEKASQLDSNYQEVQSQLANIAMTLQRKAAFGTLEAAAASLDSLYRAASAAMDKADWVVAANILKELCLLQPDYRDAIELLVRARMNLEKSKFDGKSAAAAGGKTFFYLGGTFAGLIVLTALGLIGFSPAARARLYLLRGNPADAAQIYEKMLQRHPERVKLYLPLANIYLNLGKRDERAMRAYKMILQLNLATRHREEINTIVAQRYLTEGRMDTDAIEVLENALQAELRNQKGRQVQRLAKR
ncbi:MAG: tetratricopeptide repeat protein [bacterium]